MGWTALKLSAHIWDNAKFAAMIAAFGNFEIAVMPRGQFDASCGQKINERIDTRYVPKVRFVLDQGVKNSIEVTRILEEVLPGTPSSEDKTEENPVLNQVSAELADEDIEEELEESQE